VQMEKNDPEAQRKSSLSDCTWLENEYGSFNLEALKLLMHFYRTREFTLFHFYTYSHFIFFSYIYIFLYFFFIFSSPFLSHIFLFAPLNSKMALYLPPPPMLRCCSSSGKGVIKIR
jgi:hypothetical protein